jgi:hypothetical protein
MCHDPDYAMASAPGLRRIAVRFALAGAMALVLTAAAAAQFNRGLFNVRLATPADFDGKFHFCRLVYDSANIGRGGSWRTDFPNADINMSIRLSELTKTGVSFTSGAPNPLLVRPTDDLLFQCPMVIMTAPGSAFFGEDDAARLREFLMKGGFLWADDSWGSYQWAQWESQIAKVLPPSEYPILDLPMDHPLLRTQFVVTEIPQIPNIGYFRRSGGDTSEAGADSAVPVARMIADAKGRVLVFMTHNTDISDSWEREGEDASYFYAFSPRGYALGINVFLYAMTH